MGTAIDLRNGLPFVRLCAHAIDFVLDKLPGAISGIGRLPRDLEEAVQFSVYREAVAAQMRSDDLQFACHGWTPLISPEQLLLF